MFRALMAAGVFAAATAHVAAQTTDDGQWTMPAKNYASTRFSSLDQINTQNAGSLKLAWTFSTGLLRGHEAAPLVVGDTMYIVTPWPNLLQALDLKAGGKLKWTYDPKPSAASQGVACCDVVNRGALAVVIGAINWLGFNFNWKTDIHGSVVWMIMTLHTFETVTAIIVTAFLLVLIALGRFTDTHRKGVDFDSLTWYFVVGIWLPIYATIFIAPYILQSS